MSFSLFAIQSSRPTLQLLTEVSENAEPNSVELTTIELGRQVFHANDETEKAPLVLEKSRVTDCCGESAVACVRCTITLLCALGSIATVMYFIFGPGTEIHPNECDKYSTLYQEIVTSTGAFMQQSFESLLSTQNITMPVRHVVNSFENNLMSMMTSSPYYRNCDNTQTIHCGKLIISLIDGLHSSRALISNTVQILAVTANINVTSQLTESIRNQLCGAVDYSIHCRNPTPFCEFIP